MTPDGEQQVPVEKLLGHETKRRSRWRVMAGRLGQWRDWNLPYKLAAVTLIPIVLAVSLGLSTWTAERSRAADVELVDTAMDVSVDVGALLDAVQRERAVTAMHLTDGDDVSKDIVTDARVAVDRRVGPAVEGAAALARLDADAERAMAPAPQLGANLAEARGKVDDGAVDPVEAIGEYTTITTTIAMLDGAAAARVSDGAVGRTSQALREVRAVKEAVSLQHALLFHGAMRDSLTPSELATLRTAEVRIADRKANFDAVATAAQRDGYADTVSEDVATARERIVHAALGELGAPSHVAIAEISAKDWRDQVGAMFNQLGQVETVLGSEALDTTSSAVSNARTKATVLAALLIIALVAAIIVVFVVTLHLLRSLRVLAASAQEVAAEKLPAAVADLQEATPSRRAGGDDLEQPVIDPVPITTNDEIGEVARAFDEVNAQALRLAAEQAAMRNAYSSVFVNLSRRSQSLVQRQLQLIEKLEADEEDADQLATLFQLDHLATRMRRNNENLMVLSGAETTGRRSGRPVSTADLLRAAVSEIEQYQRVVVQSPPTTKVVGHAASDLMRLLAELLDNATAFSPPESKVTVSSAVAHDGSMTIDVLDSGIGMNAAEVEEANERIAGAASLASGGSAGKAMVTSRRMGLFVVGRLASKHGITVRLHGGAVGAAIDGVRASISVPSELVIGAGGGPLTSEMPAITDEMAGLPPRRPSDAPKPSPWPRQDANATPPEQRNGKLPAGEALFVPETTPLADWWTAATQQPADDQSLPQPEHPRPGPEITPIFDEMLSAWFSSSNRAEGDAKATDDDADGAAKRAWDFAADANLRTVEEIAQRAEPESFTEAGLPKRQRGEYLLPGSAIPMPAAPSPSRSAMGRADLPARDPLAVRGKLSSFQRGVKRGRHAKAETPMAPDVQQPPATNGDAALPQRTTGLPKRRKGEHLAVPAPLADGAPPGSNGKPSEPAPQPDRDPSAMRGRLSSFQQGVRRARGTATQDQETTESKTPTLEGE